MIKINEIYCQNFGIINRYYNYIYDNQRIWSKSYNSNSKLISSKQLEPTKENYQYSTHKHKAPGIYKNIKRVPLGKNIKEYILDMICMFMLNEYETDYAKRMIKLGYL